MQLSLVPTAMGTCMERLFAPRVIRVFWSFQASGQVIMDTFVLLHGPRSIHPVLSRSFVPRVKMEHVQRVVKQEILSTWLPIGKR